MPLNRRISLQFGKIAQCHTNKWEFVFVMQKTSDYKTSPGCEPILQVPAA